MVLGFGESFEQKQHKDLVANSQEANDSNVAMAMQGNNVAYDSQVSAMLLDIDRMFLRYKVVKIKDKDGLEVPAYQCIEKYAYLEPYKDESLAFMEELEERKLLNQFGMTMSQVKMFADKYDLDWHLPLNDIIHKRTDFLINSRTTGKPGKLAKSQFVDSSAMISRQVIQPKKKGFLGGLLG